MITKDEIQELLHSTETYRVERTTSTDERSKSRAKICFGYALQGGRRREPAGDMDKFQEAICAFANDLSGSHIKGYLILRAYDNGGKTGGKVGGDAALIEMTDIQKGIIDLIRADASISIDQLAVKLSVKKRTLEREIANMKQKGYISRTGSPRSGKWEVIIPYNCVAKPS